MLPVHATGASSLLPVTPKNEIPRWSSYSYHGTRGLSVKLCLYIPTQTIYECVILTMDTLNSVNFFFTMRNDVKVWLKNKYICRAQPGTNEWMKINVWNLTLIKDVPVLFVTVLKNTSWNYWLHKDIPVSLNPHLFTPRWVVDLDLGAIEFHFNWEVITHSTVLYQLQWSTKRKICSCMHTLHVMECTYNLFTNCIHKYYNIILNLFLCGI